MWKGVKAIQVIRYYETNMKINFYLIIAKRKSEYFPVTFWFAATK